MADEEYYPHWLSTALLSGALPWDKAVRTDLAMFLAAYSLHDSEWIALLLDPIYNGGALAVIRWDTIWTEGRVPYPSDFLADWPILFLRFQRLFGGNQAGYEMESPSPTRGISTAECIPVAGRPRFRTVIADHYGGRVELEHSPEVDVLCLARSGAVLPVPGLSAV
jgi:hypothetical protein